MMVLDKSFGLEVGIEAESRAYAMGGRAEKGKCIITPVEDRFPLQSCDLEIEKFLICRLKAGLKWV